MDQSLVQALLHPSVFISINIILFLCGILVLLMQPGFMLLEMGSVSRKNAINNVFKNFIDLCLCGLFFWWIGFDILNGTSPLTEVFKGLGLTQPVTDDAPRILAVEPIAIFFQFVFASTAVTITSGCVTGRVHPFHYVVYSVIFSSIIYPIVAFFVWNPMGIFYGVFTDFAGSVVVHAVGGFAGLAGAILVGPRIGFYRHGADDYGTDVVDALAESHQPHNVPLAALGVFFLWIGWYGFNAGTHFAAGLPEFTSVEGTDLIAALTPIFDTFGQIIVNTTLAPCMGATVVAIALFASKQELDMLSIMNGAIAGLVGITASADAASALGAVFIGGTCGLIFLATRSLLDTFRIDDPVQAFSAHGTTGIFGVVAVSFFARDGGLDLGMFVSQLSIGILIAAFSFSCAWAVFSASVYALRGAALLPIFEGPVKPGYKDNFLRVETDYELEGLDMHVHGRDAYNVYENA
ncbi:MAG: hypothetical protein AAGE61_22365 [Pseudomonadota bacterium]